MIHAHPTSGTISCPVCDTTPTSPGPEAVRSEPLTHREWRGAECPQPDDAPAVDISSRRSEAKEG